MVLKTDALLALDLERSCWEGTTPENEETEIISIGLARLDLSSLSIVKKQVYLVRPARSSISAFCTELTGLTLEKLRKEGRPLNEVIGSIRKEWGPLNRLCVAWGEDGAWLTAECNRIGLKSPFRNMLNLSVFIQVVEQVHKGVSLEERLLKEGLLPDHPLHDAGVDAANLARLAGAIIQRIRL
jgi:inhibitor of KinA sporulation pathway (predicted exonuclease)